MQLQYGAINLLLTTFFYFFFFFFLFNGWDLKFSFYNFKFQSFIAIALGVIISIPKINYLCDFKEVWGTIVIIYLLWSFFLLVRIFFFFLDKLVRKFWFWVWVFLYSRIFFFFLGWGGVWVLGALKWAVYTWASNLSRSYQSYHLAWFFFFFNFFFKWDSFG